MHHLRVELPPDARSVSAARQQLRDLMATAPDTDWADAAVLALSEVVTNAIVHTSTPVAVEAWATERGLRVEVGDQSPHLPSPRSYAVTSGTGRGLHMLDSSVDRWGATPQAAGKVVWFEIGEPSAPAADSDRAAPPRELRQTDSSAVTVTLLNAPLLMAWAWQEHAQALLREHLLFSLDSDPHVMDQHAEASDALNLLHQQLPIPQLPDDPDELLADALEPGVSAEVLQLQIPQASVPHFRTLDTTLHSASEAASEGLFLGPPTQPEISELRDWICDEVARQAARPGEPRPWAPRTGIREPLADQTALRARYRQLLDHDQPFLATDEASIIVAVTPPIVEFLGYRSEGDLLGRRVIAVVPHRYHQAHIAGTTLNATNGRDRLLNVPLTVPVLRADGTESPVELRVTSHRLDNDHRVFVAHFTLPPAEDRRVEAAPGRRLGSSC